MPIATITKAPANVDHLDAADRVDQTSAILDDNPAAINGTISRWVHLLNLGIRFVEATDAIASMAAVYKLIEANQLSLLIEAAKANP